MAVLGINLTTSDPVYSWADLTPARPTLPQHVVDAREFSESCWREWLRLANLFEEGNATHEEVEEAFAVAAEAEETYSRLKQEQAIVIH